MTLEAIINWGLTILWFSWGAWVFFNASKHNMDKKVRWTIRLMFNPFAIKKFKTARAEQA